MTTRENLNLVLWDWSELFMHRSFCDFKEFLDRSGLSTSQVMALMRLHHEGTCGVSSIGEHLGITPAAASQMVDRLVQQGLLDRSEAVIDRRARRLALSDKGRALVESGIEARRGWLEDLTASLSEEQQVRVFDVLQLLVQAARRRENC
jgi:DNA-binding MarR family transcriptional regulator